MADKTPPAEPKKPEKAAPATPATTWSLPGGDAEAVLANNAKDIASSVGWKDMISKSRQGTLFEGLKEGEKLLEGDAAKAAKNEVFHNMNFAKKGAASFAGNLSQGGVLTKTRALVGAGTTAYFGSGLVMDTGRLLNIVPLKKDAATGQDIQVGLGNIAIDAAGTAGGLWLACRGGSHHAMGH